jgi:hypothetical protein
MVNSGIRNTNNSGGREYRYSQINMAKSQIGKLMKKNHSRGFMGIEYPCFEGKVYNRINLTGSCKKIEPGLGLL